MEHKAFLFRFRDFQKELRPILEASLASGDVTPVIAFITSDLRSFRDPYEGESLGDDWEDLLETKDVHQYGDFALSKYYDLGDDIGLGARWQEVQEPLERELGASTAVLGQLVGVEDNYFDPGKMGAYFQSESDVRAHLREVERLSQPALQPLVELLRRAATAGAGLYVTF